MKENHVKFLKFLAATIVIIIIVVSIINFTINYQKVKYTGIVIQELGDYEDIEIQTFNDSSYWGEWTDVSLKKPDSFLMIKASTPGVWRIIDEKGNVQIEDWSEIGSKGKIIFQGKPGSCVILEYLPKTGAGFYVSTKEYIRLRVIE